MQAACEAFVSSYRTSYRMPIVTVRINNIYGPNQWDVKVVPRFIKLAFEEKEFTIQVYFKQLIYK
jgi:dTDP-D-glucose 4,6-dehydratase